MKPDSHREAAVEAALNIIYEGEPWPDQDYPRAVLQAAYAHLRKQFMEELLSELERVRVGNHPYYIDHGPAVEAAFESIEEGP